MSQLNSSQSIFETCSWWLPETNCIIIQNNHDKQYEQLGFRALFVRLSLWDPAGLQVKNQTVTHKGRKEKTWTKHGCQTQRVVNQIKTETVQNVSKGHLQATNGNYISYLFAAKDACCPCWHSLFDLSSPQLDVSNSEGPASATSCGQTACLAQCFNSELPGKPWGNLIGSVWISLTLTNRSNCTPLWARLGYVKILHCVHLEGTRPDIGVAGALAMLCEPLSYSIEHTWRKNKKNNCFLLFFVVFLLFCFGHVHPVGTSWQFFWPKLVKLQGALPVSHKTRTCWTSPEALPLPSAWTPPRSWENVRPRPSESEPSPGRDVFFSKFWFWRKNLTGIWQQLSIWIMNQWLHSRSWDWKSPGWKHTKTIK